MKNIVPCKMCSSDFDYSPGLAGNAKQVCEKCIKVVGKEELIRLEEESIISGNRYLIRAPNRKDEYDPLDILVDGNMPEFNSDGDRFICAMEMAFFLRKQKGGFCGMEKRVAELLNHLGTIHATILVKQWSFQMMEAAAKNADLNPILTKIVELVY